MSGSLNKVMLIGHLGAEPETRRFPDGNRVVSFSVATSESWKNDDNEKQERTTWTRISILSDGLAGIAEKYLHKGSRIFIEGQLENRKWKDDKGVERYATEVVLRPFNGALTLLDAKPDDGAQRPEAKRGQGRGQQPAPR